MGGDGNGAFVPKVLLVSLFFKTVGRIVHHCNEVLLSLHEPEEGGADAVAPLAGQGAVLPRSGQGSRFAGRGWEGG